MSASKPRNRFAASARDDAVDERPRRCCAHPDSRVSGHQRAMAIDSIPPSRSSFTAHARAAPFVGFAIGAKHPLKMDDLIRLIRKVRTKQVDHPNRTFVSQIGMYEHPKSDERPKGKVVAGRGAQVAPPSARS